LAGSDCRNTAYWHDAALLEQHLAQPAGFQMAKTLPAQSASVHERLDSSRQPFLFPIHAGLPIDVFNHLAKGRALCPDHLGTSLGDIPATHGLRRPNQMTLRPVSPLPLAMQDGPAEANDELLKA